MRNQTCIFTGHRIIPYSKRPALQKMLYQQVMEFIKQGIIRFGSGGALGFDTMAAETVLDIRRENPQIQLCLYLPCKNQDKYWNIEDKMRYARLRREADEIVFTGEQYCKQCMHVRNRYMVEQARICLAFLEKDYGGTAYTVRYAKQKGLLLINLNDYIIGSQEEEC